MRQQLIISLIARRPERSSCFVVLGLLRLNPKNDVWNNVPVLSRSVPTRLCVAECVIYRSRTAARNIVNRDKFVLPTHFSPTTQAHAER